MCQLRVYDMVVSQVGEDVVGKGQDGFTLRGLARILCQDDAAPCASAKRGVVSGVLTGTSLPIDLPCFAIVTVPRRTPRVRAAPNASTNGVVQYIFGASRTAVLAPYRASRCGFGRARLRTRTICA